MKSEAKTFHCLFSIFKNRGLKVFYGLKRLMAQTGKFLMQLKPGFLKPVKPYFCMQFIFQGLAAVDQRVLLTFRFFPAQQNGSA